MSSKAIEQNLIQVGNVCTQWSFLEYLISQAIWYMLGLEKEKQITSSDIGKLGTEIYAISQQLIKVYEKIGIPTA